jgi:hypothetical protein
MLIWLVSGVYNKEIRSLSGLSDDAIHTLDDKKKVASPSSKEADGRTSPRLYHQALVETNM